MGIMMGKPNLGVTGLELGRPNWSYFYISLWEVSGNVAIVMKFQLLIIGLILATLYLFNFLPQLLTHNTGLVPPDH
jgi:hypothetical protein